MRKQTKYILKGGLVAAGTVAIIDLILQYNAITEKGQPWNWINFDGKRLLQRSLLGFGIGGLVGQALYLLHADKESEKEFNTEAYLRKNLSDASIKGDSLQFKKVLSLRQKVREWLAIEFSDVLAGRVEDSGSFANRTAIRGSYDLDIIIPFIRRSYDSLHEMVDDLFESTQKKFPQATLVKKHKKGVVLEFRDRHTYVKFDLIPGRERGNYARDKTLNLYKRTGSLFGTDSSMKIFVPLQNKIVVNEPHTRNIIKLLKIYRDRNNLPLPSVLIEQCVVDALSRSKPSLQNSLKNDLLDCMVFIANRLGQKTLRDIANSNNNLNDKVSESDRYMIAAQLFDDVNRIDRNPHYLKEIFEIENL